MLDEWRTIYFIGDPSTQLIHDGSIVMRNLTIIIAALVSLIFICSMRGSAQEQKAFETEMKKKLEFSKNILDGLVTEDFSKILENAEALNKLGRTKWLENESAAYRTQNQVFWFTTGTLVLTAKEKNIDGATLAYTQMTHSCVNCHKLLRQL